MQQASLGKRTSVVVEPHEVKMSEVLEAFVDPYLDDAKNHAQRGKLFSLAVAAWNLALVPEVDRQHTLEELIQKGLIGSTPAAKQDFRSLIGELVARKQTFFAENTRWIVEFQLQEMGETFHLSVASTLAK